MKKISSISGHGCIRAHKMNLALLNKGHDVHLTSSKLSPFFQSYKSYSLANDIGQMIETIKMHARNVDIFHAHNEPSYYVALIKEHTDLPVILDVHDSFLGRVTLEQAEQDVTEGRISLRISVEERNNLQMADGLVFPSQEFARLVREEFNLKQPYIVLPGYVPQIFYQYASGPWYGGLVYEGKVVSPAKDASEKAYNYADYTIFAKQAYELGVDFHLYSGRTDNNFMKDYASAFRHKPFEYEDLIRNVGRHDWGLVGNITFSPEWNVAMPNKLFEYIAAGVPIVCMNAKACEDFVLEHGIGIAVKSIEELKERWAEHRVCRTKLYKIRQRFTMDANIDVLERFYDVVLDSPKEYKPIESQEVLRTALIPGGNGQHAS